jgi:hypothetical protein
MPQIDHTGKLAVSLYGKGTTVGDTAVLVNSTGNLLTVGVPLAEAITLKASGAVATAAANTLGVANITCSKYKRIICILDVTAAATDANDTLDVYVDVSLDGVLWLNAIHFTQVVGTGGAKSFYAILDPSAPGTSVIDATSDAAAGAVRPALWGPQLRGRWTTVDGGSDADMSFTFSVKAYGQA